ncbi:hypothetical protein [Photobacterium damselae]|uniref:hypothetical protein n=1 Tax=Photobacterium damselae TaxID=38293 RepID=UPI0014855DE7|nr:hypothetical protein [Photobacterium damselae]MDC4168493.1 hypothetical protein [Photobacterium damselae]NVH50200.1 hypothetical protein [Photobacterium damselae subsp. damselae]NVO81371.1 hypothetical protein [Photobacterium damselae subsp. damselae]
MSRIVVVGGGAAGLELSTLLTKSVRKEDEIVLVEPEMIEQEKALLGIKRFLVHC